MMDFFVSTPMKINTDEVEIPIGIGLPIILEEGKLKRLITISHLLRYYKDINFSLPEEYGLGDTPTRVYQDVKTIKSQCLVFDATYLKAIGYTKIWFEDRAPGDTSISYIMWGEK
jgi:hypothetical protein